MKRLKHILQKSIHTIESSPTSFALWILAFTSLIIARLTIENWLAHFQSRSITFLFYEFTHTFFFFLLSFLIFLPIIAYFGKVSLASASNVLLFGFLIILTPPLLDAWISGGAGYWSFYKFDSLSGLWYRYLTLFGDRPDIGITYGVRIEVVLTTLFFSVYTFLKKRSFLHVCAAAFVTYTLLFVLGTLPSWITFLFLGFEKNIFLINGADIAQFTLAPPLLFQRSDFDFTGGLNVKMSLLYAPFSVFLGLVLAWRFFRIRCVAFIKNIRLPQIIYHEGLFVTGAFLAFVFSQERIVISLFNSFGLLNIAIAIACAWIASVITNDCFDQKTDTLTNAFRPLPQKVFSQKEYASLGVFFFITSLIFSGLVHFKVMALLLAYQALAWLYSVPPFRLKRFPFLATLIASIASLLILFSGFILIGHNEDTTTFPLAFVFFFLFVFISSLPLKDFKDIAGDRADNVFTLPVLFGEQKSKLFIGSAIFLAFMTSVLVFHEPRLFWWALLCGSLSFWIVNTSQANEHTRLNYRTLPLWLLSLITVYAVILVWIIL